MSRAMLGITARRAALEGEAETRPLSWRLITRLFQYTRPYAARRNWLVLCVLLRSIQLPLLAWVFAQVINHSLVEHDPRGLVIGTAIFTALAVVTMITFHFRQRLALELGEAVIHDLRNEVFAHLQRMPMSFFDRTKLGRIISRMTSDAETLRAGVSEVFFVSLVMLGQMVVAGILMLWVDWVLFGMVVLVTPIILLINAYFRPRLGRAHQQMQESFSRLTARLAESVSGVRVTQGFVRQDRNAQMFHQMASSHAEYNLAVQRLQGVFSPLLELNSQFFIACLLMLGGYRVLHPQIQTPVQTLIDFFFLAGVFFQPFNALGTQYTQAISAMAGAERVFGLLDRKPEWEDRPDAIDLPDVRGRVTFENLWFEYEPGRPVLHDINFVAEPGQTIALVGHTGSGKSSIVNLISKFYLPTRGRLLIDSYDILDVTSDSLHRQMGLVQQHNFLFTGSVMENIRFGRPSASDDEVFEAARKLGCLELLEGLPEGLYTVVGEGGTGVSLGQRQLICFTRAMLADPRIFVLDEATSAVDTVTEVRIQTALARLLRDRTSFVVAHRLSTIRHADLVLVLDQGRIVERGTHLELLEHGGVYANLYRQFIRSTEE